LDAPGFRRILKTFADGYWNASTLRRPPDTQNRTGEHLVKHWRFLQIWFGKLRALGISLQRRRSWCISIDPEFEAKSADIIGLYLGVPANAVVLSLDGKTSIQALERGQGWLKMPDGRSMTHMR